MALARQEGQWSLLPTNLWAEMFSRRHPRNHRRGYAGCGEDWPYSTKEQSDFFRLRMVCETFNKTFQLHKDLYSSLVIGRDLQSCHLPSLVKWLRCHHSHVRILRLDHGTAWMEMMLVALHSPHSCLEVVHNFNTVPETVKFLLSTFQSIKTCTLHASQSMDPLTLHASQTVSLQPLSSLPLLTTLALRLGRFSTLEAIPHLTSLSLEYAIVVCMQDCSCVTPSVELKIYSAELFCFHCRNVSACLSLESLFFSSSIISATIRIHHLDQAFIFPEHGAARIPAGLSALTALTHLKLECPQHEMELDWLTAFLALQSVRLKAFAAYFPPAWSIMTRVTHLEVNLNLKDSQISATLFFSLIWAH